MRIVPWLLSLIFPLCGTVGSHGVPAPSPLDLQHLPAASSVSALIAPPGFVALPKLIAPVFEVPVQKLDADLQTVGASQPRTYKLPSPAPDQLAFVERSAVANFPDIVQLAAVPVGPGRSSYVLYSHSIYGSYDFGVNLHRVKAWAAAIERAVDR
ncbi:MAG: hypothetical protein B7Z81_12800 [Acidocella sp. 20-61-6]|nr:MAG: hypothetical protein B7Z81_12800 [Acidocella sp. 20-61-6]